MFHIFNPLGKEDFFSPNVSLKNLQAFKPYLADTVYQLKSPPFPREAIFVSMLAHTHTHKKWINKGHAYFILCFVLSFEGFFPHHPRQSARNPPPCMNGACFQWSDSPRARGGGMEEGKRRPSGCTHCLARQPMNWFVWVVFTGAGKLPSKTQTSISKHHSVRPATSIPYNPLPFPWGT